ncbi:DUF4031 domain-containing protein, partial [Streptomyces niveus]|uniref:DUF4031 domain-containing protein n=1 Tax=Streptomyces niveus TaxID=193462 RepID=UPI003F540B41
AFERDHYDVPAHRYGDAVRAGAVEVLPRPVRAGRAPPESPGGPATCAGPG